MSMLISVAIPTLNRPAMLLEAIESVARQSYGEWEVVVVDDGSDPPVDPAALAPLLGDRFTLVRHNKPKGVAEAKNAGVRASSGEIILHLDDDDLLAEDALSTIEETYRHHKDLDCVFLNIEPFGRFASGSVENQTLALSNLLERVATREQEHGLVFLGEGLFEGLLKSVPLALQRPAARRGTWNIVGGLTTDLFSPEPNWALRASLVCRMALLSRPLSRWRCDNQNLFSKPEMLNRAAESNVLAAERLLDRFRVGQAQNARYIRHARHFLADAHFDLAYRSHCAGGPSRWHSLLRSFSLAPGWRHLSLGARSLVPRARRK